MSRLSRTLDVSRQTLYTWADQGLHALVQAFTPTAAPTTITPALERQVLTLLVEGHASYRGMQACLRAMPRQQVSVGTLVAIVAEAQRRALRWLATHSPPTSRALALDEIYGNARRGAYLNVVDANSGAVWATVGPVAVDAESWTLVLWELQARGLHWHLVATDGAQAMREACTTVTPQIPQQRDLWHVLHRASQVQGRLDRRCTTLAAQTATVARQAARVAAGQRPRGRCPKSDLRAHAADLATAQRVAADLRYLTRELHRLLEVVVLDGRGLLDQGQRQGDLAALLALLAELACSAPAPQHGELQQLHQHLAAALPHLLTFVTSVERVQQVLAPVLPPAYQALLAWTWLRRERLGWSSVEIAAAIPPEWRTAARVLLATWDEAVRVSTAVERWHSILRPPLAVHRTLAPGLLALLAVWHNHRVFTRGVHAGQNPLHMSGMPEAPSDWLVARGYPPAEPAWASRWSPTSTDGLALAA